MDDKKTLDMDVKVDFFEENPVEIQEAFKHEPMFQKTLGDILEFMSYMGVKSITLSGKTYEDEVLYRKNLQERERSRFNWTN